MRRSIERMTSIIEGDRADQTAEEMRGSRQCSAKHRASDASSVRTVSHGEASTWSTPQKLASVAFLLLPDRARSEPSERANPGHERIARSTDLAGIRRLMMVGLGLAEITEHLEKLRR